MGRLIGYARVSTAEQDLGLQLAALRSAGGSDAHIFCDTASGARTARPGLETCVHALEPRATRPDGVHDVCGPESHSAGYLPGLTDLPGHVLSLCGPRQTRGGDYVASPRETSIAEPGVPLLPESRAR